MAHLVENAVRPTMGGLINDLAMELDAEQQRLLALWAVKTAMVIEGVKQAKNGFYTPEERNAFRQTLIPPTQTAVWVGRCIQSNNLHGEARKLHVSNPTATNPLEDGCATTFVIGRLVMQVLSIKLKPDTKLVQVWPVEKQRVGWPPPESFTELNYELWDLRRRFAVGISTQERIRL
jgi:hypothetical protein